ncbi:MAG: PTS sugar transporter subunit IIB [Anaerorhabdus sp.]|uniref:PTS sugar transporter subunit IIB n=1 Tax=Anaerorhabdus sp. TaxID=1872524 RepID=UPI003A8522BF
MKIITVCGLGVGSSLILKMTVDSAMNQLGVKCTIEHWDMGTIKGQNCDLIVTTEGFRKNFADQENVVYIDNIVDVKETKEKLETYLKLHNLM